MRESPSITVVRDEKLDGTGDPAGYAPRWPPSKGTRRNRITAISTPAAPIPTAIRPASVIGGACAGFVCIARVGEWWFILAPENGAGQRNLTSQQPPA